MNGLIRNLAAVMAAGVVLTGAAHAVTLVPGGYSNLRDGSGNLLDLGFSAAADPSLNGIVVASASRSLLMDTVLQSANPFLPVTHQSLTAVIDDWVVRRADTGTLDFYMRMRNPSSSNFGGTIVRPTSVGTGAVDSLMTVGYRNDMGASLTNPGSAPGYLGRPGAGTAFAAIYSWTDQVSLNSFLTGSGAPIFFRSNATGYVDGGIGSVSFSYSDSSGAAQNGQTTFSFFAPTNPVPEPTKAALMLVGIAGLAFVNRRTQRR